MPREEAAAHGLPDVRDLQRPPGRQPGLTAPGTMAERGLQGPVTDREPLLAALGVELDEELLTLALTHRSFAYENGGLPTNERLEFLGDSVLGLVVTDELYRSQPDLPEGQLAKLRASVVNMTSLAGVARRLGDGGLGPLLLLGRGEEATGGREKDSILADALEALIGAIHLGGGLDTASAVVHRLFDPLLAESATRGAGLDWKTSLQELGAARGLGAPTYVVEDTGPDHAKSFTAAVLLSGTEYGRGGGRTKKAAEQWVAGRTVAAVEVRHPRAVRRHLEGAEHFVAALTGRTLTAAHRRGKYLWLPMAEPDGAPSGRALVAHLGMSGQLLVEKPDEPDEVHLRARFRFTDGGRELRFVDQRTFGGLAVEDAPSGAD